MPRVSVVVPSYNHARFLDRRIQSVLDQTLQDIEVIILDDASTDDSRDVIARYADDPKVRTILNEKNSGSVFRQWNKGLRQATGELVWIAESDDYADPRFLEVLAARLDEYPSAGVAYCQSWVVDENDQKLHIIELARRRFNSDRWERDFFNDGRNECATYFSRRCVINNASSALLRRSVVEQVGYAEEDWRIAGDWIFWSKMLLASDIVFVAQPLNYWRQHSTTVRARTTGNGEMIAESYKASAYIAAKANAPADVLERARADRFGDWVCYSEDYLFGPRQNYRIYKQAREFDPFVRRRIARYLPLAPIRIVGRPLRRFVSTVLSARRKPLNV